MATVIAQATHGSYPGMTYRLDAEQTGGSGNSRTIKLTLYLKCGGSTTSSWYGYPVNHRFNINGGWYDWQTTKGTESWNGTQAFRTFTWTRTVDVGTTSSKGITVGFQTDSYNGDNSWDLTKTATFTVGQTNVAPVLSGSIGTNISGIISETTTKIELTSPAASDTNLSGYRFAVSVNGGGYTEIYKGSSRTYTHNISGGEGTTYKYSCYAYDSAGANSATIYSGTITKNTLTGGWFSGHSNDVGYSTTSFTLNFTGGSNSNGSPVRYHCYSDNVTVYNGQETTSGSQTISIWRSGAAPSGPYIKFDDLKNYFAGSSYNGRLHVGLRTGNDYGTYKWSGGSIGVDLRVNPQPARGQEIAQTSELSTIYKRVASTGNYYFIPDGSGVVRVHWNNGWGHLGEGIRYEVYVAYGSGGWQKVADVPHSGEYHFFNHQISKQTVSQQFKYLIRTVTSYGWYSDAVTAAQTLHYYNAPGITTGTITRGATTADVKVTIKSNSSIPNINTVGSWLTTPATVSGNLTVSQTEQNIALTGLTDDGTYTLKVTYNDNTGFSGNQVANIAIGQNTPLFFVNKFGAGVNGAKADSSSALSVNGITKSTNGVHIESSEGTANTSKSHSTFVVRSGNNLANRPIDYCTIFNIGANNNSNGQLAWNYNSGELDLRFRKRHDVSGDYGAWRQIYHTGNFNPDNKMDKDSVNPGWYRSEGPTGWYSQTYGGGWYMEDTTWIRAYGGKSIYTSGNMRFDGNMSSGGLYLQKSWQQGQADCLKISNQKGYLTIAPQNDGHCHYETDRSNHWFNKMINVQGDITTYNDGNVYGVHTYRGGNYCRLANGNTTSALRVELMGQNSNYLFSTSTFYPNNSQTLGASSGGNRWGQIYSTSGSISTSDSKLKENIKPIERATKAKALSTEPTGEDMWNYVKNTNVYTFNYKARYNSDTQPWLGVLADEVPDIIFEKIGMVSKTQEEYEEELAKQEEYREAFEEEVAKIPSILTLEEEEENEYDIDGEYGNQIVEGTGLTRRELRDESEKLIEEPIRMLNSSAQIAMLQEVLSMALQEIESLKAKVSELEAK